MAAIWNNMNPKTTQLVTFGVIIRLTWEQNVKTIRTTKTVVFRDLVLGQNQSAETTLIALTSLVCSKSVFQTLTTALTSKADLVSMQRFT